MTPRSFPLTLAALAMAAGPLVAQVIAPVERSVTGVVVDSLSGKVLRGAVLYFDGDRAEHQSGRDGRFRIEHVSIGDTLLVVRSIGYVPAFIVVPPSSSASAIDLGQVTIRQVATRLDQIAVEAEAVRAYPQLYDFYRRKQEGLPGQFFTREDIDRSASRKT